MELAPSPYFFLFKVFVNMFAKFDEIPAMTSRYRGNKRDGWGAQIHGGTMWKQYTPHKHSLQGMLESGHPS